MDAVAVTDVQEVTNADAVDAVKEEFIKKYHVAEFAFKI